MVSVLEEEDCTPERSRRISTSSLKLPVGQTLSGKSLASIFLNPGTSLCNLHKLIIDQSPSQAYRFDTFRKFKKKTLKTTCKMYRMDNLERNGFTTADVSRK